jgi:hypothetical protein
MSEPTWKEVFTDRNSRKRFYVLGVALAIMFAFVFFTLEWTEKRNGFVIESWARQFLGAPIDFSIPIFTLTYSCVLLALYQFRKSPETIYRLLFAYTIMQILRGTLLLIVPLEPSPDIIPLGDPFLKLTFYNGRPNLKDLFFSGHVATILIIGFFTRSQKLRIAVFSAAIITAALLVQQRVHYIADVLAALPAAWISVRLSSYIARSSSKGSSGSAI